MLLCESPRITPTHRRILALSFLGWTFDFYDLILYTFHDPVIAEPGVRAHQSGIRGARGGQDQTVRS